MRFVGIWYDLDREVKRDEVEASSANEASLKIHRLYDNAIEPAPALAIVPKDAYGKGVNDTRGYFTNDVGWKGGTFG